MINIYILILIFLMVLAYWDSLGRFKAETCNKLLIIIFVIFLIYTTTRDSYSVRDYIQYIDYYYNPPIYIEITFRLISYVVKMFLFDDVIFLFLIYAVLAIAIKIKAITQLSNLIFLSILFWFSDVFILQELTQMRAAVATGIMLLMVQNIYVGSKRKAIFLGIVASLFHYSAIISFIMLFFKKNTISIRYWLIVFFLAFFIAVVGIDLIDFIILMFPIDAISSRLILHRQSQMMGAVANPFYLFFWGNALVTFILLYKSKIIANFNKYAYVLLKLQLVSLICYLIFIKNDTLALRLSEFFGTTSIILYPMLYYVIRQKKIALLVLFIISGYFMYYRIFRQGLIL